MKDSELNGLLFFDSTVIAILCVIQKNGVSFIFNEICIDCIYTKIIYKLNIDMVNILHKMLVCFAVLRAVQKLMKTTAKKYVF